MKKLILLILAIASLALAAFVVVNMCVKTSDGKVEKYDDENETEVFDEVADESLIQEAGDEVESKYNDDENETDENNEESVEIPSQVIDGVTVNGMKGKYTYVDLGLPSGTKWATYNVGATKPTEYGDHFAWGETKPKEDYTDLTYKWCTIGIHGYIEHFIKYNTDSNHGNVDNMTVLEAYDDAATKNWGSAWRMPTAAEIEELVKNCEWKRVDNFNNSDVEGQLGTSKMNGAIIFLPAAGHRLETNLNDEGANGYYWSSQLGGADPKYASSPFIAHSLHFRIADGDINTDDSERQDGQSVRAVLR